VRVTTDADGRGRVDLPAGYYSPGWGAPALEIRAGETTPWTGRRDALAEPPGGTARLYGRITIAGQPVALSDDDELLLCIAGRWVATDPEGWYRLEDLTPGRHFVQEPSLFPTETLAAMLPFEIQAGEELELSWNYPLCRLEGRVSDESGTAIEGALVDLYLPTCFDLGDLAPDREPRLRNRAKTEADGRFFSTPALSTGRFVVVARAPGRRLAVRRFDIGEECPGDLDLDIRLPPARGGLRVHLVEEESGRALEKQMRVALRSLENDRLRIMDDEWRAHEWTGLPPGRYELSAEPMEDGDLASVREEIEIAADEHGVIEVTVAIPAGGTLLVEAEDASGRPFAEPFPEVFIRRLESVSTCGSAAGYGKDDELDPGDPVDPDGRLCAPGLSAGRYEVQIEREGFRGVRLEATVAPGERTVVQASLERMW
jgi:hypothetical protein